MLKNPLQLLGTCRTLTARRIFHISTGVFRMVATTQGTLDGKNLRIGIAVSRFNETVTNNLLSGATIELKRLGVAEADMHVVRVPGALELSIALEDMAESKRFDALIALGCIIKGKTDHYEIVARETGAGAAYVSRKWALPVIFEVLACPNEKIAKARSGASRSKGVNRGVDAARAAVEMAVCRKNLAHDLRNQPFRLK